MAPRSTRLALAGFVLLLACGPSVDIADAGSGGTGTQPTTTSTSSADDATSSTGATTPSADSSTSDANGSSTTMAEPMPDACIDSTFDFLLLTIDQDGPFDIGATCTVQDAYPSIDVEFLELSCPMGDVTLLSNGVGFEDYFEPGQTVELIAAGDPGVWEHVALLDARGNFIVGSYDLSPEAPDLTDLFLSVDFEVFDTDCEDEVTDTGCAYHRAGVELTLEGQTQRVQGGTVGDFGSVLAYAAVTSLGDTDTCLEGAGMILGYFTMLVPL